MRRFEHDNVFRKGHYLGLTITRPGSNIDAICQNTANLYN